MPQKIIPTFVQGKAATRIDLAIVSAAAFARVSRFEVVDMKIPGHRGLLVGLDDKRPQHVNI